MQNASRYIILSGLAAGCLSMIYFLSLVLHLPFFITVPVIVVAIVFLFRTYTIDDNGAINNEPAIIRYAAHLILILCVGLLVFHTTNVAYEYGGWDAWCMWNLHAKYLAGGGATWKTIFLNTTVDHTDYPLLLPGVNGFFMRLFNNHLSTLIPFVFSFCITLFIPLLIFLEHLRKNWIIACLVLFFFAQDTFYLRNGVSQYADTVLAFFFLAALICIDNVAKNKRNILLAALALGCCMWTKNEGIILSAAVVFFNARLFFSTKNIRYFLGGIFLPLLTLAIFKAGYAPPNDVLSGQGAHTLQQLFIAARYETIWKHFSEQIRENFFYVATGSGLYLLMCIIQRAWPSKHFVMLALCLVIYLMIYIVSPQELNWHLATSLERLMHQLMPAMMYVMAQKISEIKLNLNSRKVSA